MNKLWFVMISYGKHHLIPLETRKNFLDVLYYLDYLKISMGLSSF